MDLYLQAPNKATMDAVMRATFEALADRQLASDEPTPMSAEFATGGRWYMHVIGAFFEPSGETVDTDFGPQPVMVERPGYHGILRWNDANVPVPPVPSGLTLIWRSDETDVDGNPVPPPTWWTQVLA